MSSKEIQTIPAESKKRKVLKYSSRFGVASGLLFLVLSEAITINTNREIDSMSDQLSGLENAIERRQNYDTQEVILLGNKLKRAKKNKDIARTMKDTGTGLAIGGLLLEAERRNKYPSY